MDSTAYDAWRALPFPAGSAVGAVDEAHAELAYWDAMTAESVIPVVEYSSTYDSGAIDFRSGLNALRERLVDLREGAARSEAETLTSYIRYADALCAVNRWAAAT